MVNKILWIAFCAALLVIVGCASRVHYPFQVDESKTSEMTHVCPDEAFERVEFLGARKMDLPENVPLRTIPLLRQMNSQLRSERATFRIALYSSTPLSWRERRFFNTELALLPAKFSYFKARSDTELRNEISSGSMLDCLKKLRRTFLMGAYCKGKLILIGQEINIPHDYPEF